MSGKVMKKAIVDFRPMTFFNVDRLAARTDAAGCLIAASAMVLSLERFRKKPVPAKVGVGHRLPRRSTFKQGREQEARLERARVPGKTAAERPPRQLRRASSAAQEPFDFAFSPGEGLLHRLALQVTHDHLGLRR